jgi:hypothetical protein
MKEYFEILERAICEGALVAQPGGPGTWQRIVCPLGAEPVVVGGCGGGCCFVVDRQTREQILREGNIQKWWIIYVKRKKARDV